MDSNSSASTPRREWEGNVRDNVSVVMYCKKEEEEQDKLQFLLLEEDGLLRFPRREIRTRETPERSANNSTIEQNVTNDDSITDSSTEASVYSPVVWPKDYSKVAENMARKIAGDDVSLPLSPKLIMLTRVYMPVLRRHYQHFYFAINVSCSTLQEAGAEGFYRIATTDEIKKMSTMKLERQDFMMLMTYVECQVNGGNSVVGSIFREDGPHKVWRHLEEDKMTPDDFLLRAPGYREQDIEMIFEEFIRCSYPYNTVCFRDIKPLLTDLGFKDKEDLIFRAFDRQKVGELGSREFVLGLTALDPLTAHGKGPAEIRCRYIFKYYDNNEDDVLEINEIRNMVQDIAQLQGLDTTPEVIEEKTEKALENFGVNDGSGLSLTNFLISVGNLRFRGTSILLRAGTSIIQHIIHRLGSSRKRRGSSPFRSPTSSEFLHKKLRKSMPNEQSKNSDNNNIYRGEGDIHIKCFGNSSSGSISNSDGVFLTPDSSSYTLAQHTVKVRRSGQVTDIHLLLDMERAGEVCDTGLDIDDSVTTDPPALPQFRRGSLTPMHHEISFSRSRVLDRFQSVEAFNTKSLPNEMITALRFFEHGSSKKPAFDWGEVDLVKLGQYVISLCTATKELMENEPRLLRLSTPCYILGDIHGNFRDLICFEKALWRVGPHLTPANFLFLGDYVDRGDYGVEVVSYLFAQKLQAPLKFFLLRGNHEVRDIQQMFTFHEECLNKFGDRLGTKVWNAINDVFDCMPLAAVVDKKIFCIHGGIPKVDGSLQDLDKIPCPLPTPENQSNLAWQMMWNDPVSVEDMNEIVREQLQSNHGFAYNEKRQTAYVFNQDAFDSFLKRNGLTHVVRAHEVKQAGFEIQQSGRLMTVFSSSHYCGGSNEAACILVHNYRMRIIRIDTS